MGSKKRCRGKGCEPLDVAQVIEIMCNCLMHNILVLIQEMFMVGIMIDFHENVG
ncbi:MAG: hypothetical protein KKH94_04110 [Candidatus Omnitrophica bacterium]|nr:hypothetical protein [Candidatus Omnitrophota bacterium]